MSHSLTIGRLARAAGVNLDTVRYYERSALTGYRTTERNFIRGAKSLGRRYLRRLIAPKSGPSPSLEDRSTTCRNAAGKNGTVITTCSGHGSVRDCHRRSGCR
jgi:hypothetical protein